MKCEICGKPIEEGGLALPIGFVYEGGYVETFLHGIHPECIKEIIGRSMA